jgi:hypothetical protein
MNENIALWQNGNSSIGFRKLGEGRFYAALSHGTTICGSRTCKTERAALVACQAWVKASIEAGKAGTWERVK